MCRFVRYSCTHRRAPNCHKTRSRITKYCVPRDERTRRVSHVVGYNCLNATCATERMVECKPCQRARAAGSTGYERVGLRGGDPNAAEKTPTIVDPEQGAFLDELAREAEEYFERCNREEEEARRRERMLDALFEEEEDNDSSGDYMEVDEKPKS